MDWPKTPSGATDWDAVFEHPDHGLIPLVCAARTPAKLCAATTLVVEQLFLRDSDSVFRGDYQMQLRRLFDSDGAPPLEGLKESVSAFLRRIKDDRIARAGKPRAAAVREPDSETGEPEIEERTTEEIFAAAFRDYVRVRFDALSEELDPSAFAGGRPPFILASEFAEHFIDCLDRHFVARLIEQNRGMLLRAETQTTLPPEAYFAEQLNEKNFRAAFLKLWSDLWRELTQPKKLPARPVEEKSSLLDKFMRGKASRPARSFGMTAEEWDTVSAANEWARQIWGEIVADKGAYLRPIDDDNRLLMNILGRTPSSLQKQIASIAQIVVQGGDRATFESFQSGRDIDLALLVASYRHPDSMLGEDGFTLKMLGDYPDAVRRERFPLVTRYIFEMPGRGLRSSASA